MLLKRITGVLISFAVSLSIVWGVSHLEALRALEDQTMDIRQIAFPPKTDVSGDVVMVWLDESTMQSLPFRSPVPRNFLAKLNDALARAEAKIIAYDIFFKGSSFPEADKTLAEGLAKTNSYAVVPMRPKNLCAGEGDVSKHIAGCVDMPDKMFADALKGVGLADLPFSAFDTTVRAAQFAFETNLGTMPSLAARVFRAATGNDALSILDDKSSRPGFGPLEFSPFLDGSRKTAIRFAGPPGRIGNKDNAFKIFSAKLVADGLIPQSWLRDKIILVGAAYEDATDAYLTPYYRGFTNYARMNGVEIHANILSSLLTRQFLYNFLPWQKWGLIIAVIAIISATSLLLVPLKSAGVFVVTISAEIVLSVFAFRSFAIIVPVALPLSAGCVSYAVGIGWRALTEGRQKRFIKGVFAKYVPPAVVERMTEHPEMLKLGGEQKTVTSMFTDIASFTTISEKMDPVTLVTFLNDYLGRMNEVLFRYGATLDKYEGDAIIAFFNAPLDVERHELAAIKSAMEIRRISREITAAWKDRCGREIVTRVGINTGPAVVGNMGSEGRFDYTAIGDTINLASRLEGTNKFYGTIVMASEMTVEAVGESVIARPVDRVRVKGKTKAILLYEIAGEAETMDGALMSKLIAPYKRAFELFEERKIDESKGILNNILVEYPDDGPSKDLLKRCERAMIEPKWDLITDLTAK